MSDKNTITQLKDALLVCNSFSKIKYDFESKAISDILDFHSLFEKEYIIQYEKLPYKLNILDELHANENAHSRLLSNILKIHDMAGDHFVLKSFLNNLSEPFPSLARKIEKKIDIASQLNNIDVCIHHPEFSIIIENKIHNAQDQYKQIERYIEIERKNYRDGQICILYLTREGGSPSEYSIRKEIINNFNSRYLEIDYKTNILSWLKHLKSLPIFQNNSPSEVARAAIIQYIDHLEGMFSQREGDAVMNKELLTWLEQKLELNDKPIKIQTSKIIKKISELDTLSGFLNELLKRIFLDEFQKQIVKLKINGINSIEYDKNFGYDDYGAIYFQPVGWDRYSIAFCFCEKSRSKTKNKQLYCGIYDKEENSDDKIRKKLRLLLGSDTVEEGNTWPWGKYSEYILPENLIEEDEDFEKTINEIVLFIRKEVLEIYKKLKNFK